jgi:F-type H+-transporting ATPase subunit epsilon
MHLSLTTPRGSVVDAEVEEVTAPGSLGEFGVLPGHVPFLSAPRPGVFVYRTKEGSRLFAVGEGILEVGQSKDATAPSAAKVLVLVDEAVPAKEIDRDAAANELAAIDAELSSWKKDVGGEYRALVVRRAWAAARVDAASRVSPH